MILDMNTNKAFVLSALVAIIAILLVAEGGAHYYFSKVKMPDEVACPSDAKVCSDGSAVGRTGPNCEFVSCPSEDVMKKDDGMIKDDKATMEVIPKGVTETMVKIRGAVLAGRSDHPLLAFSPTGYDDARKSGDLIVLYFYANWCPICKAEFPKMQEAFNTLDDNKQVIGFRVSYKDDEVTPEEEALAREFGVGYQHTKVFLKNGKRILKAPDSWDKDRYMFEINKALGQ